MIESRTERRPGVPARLRLTLLITAVAIVASGAIWIVTALWVLRYIPEGNYSVDNGGWVPGRADIMEVFMPIATSAFVAITGLAFLGGWFLAGHLLRPLTAIANVADTVRRGDLTQRVRLPGPRDEFREVADAFDGMLDSVQSTLTAQRRFAANASHELRTPLAITRSVLDVAQQDSERDVSAVLSQLSSLNDRASSSVDALLLLARIDSTRPEMTSVDLSLAVEEALDALVIIAARHHVLIETDIHPAHIHGNTPLLERLATNLIHNAIVHNAPEPHDRKVFVQVTAQHNAAVMRVVNTGPVISPETTATLTEPFARGERTRTAAAGESHAGAGLGLALSDTIVRVHGGALVVRARAAGGLIVTARFALDAGMPAS